MILISHRGNLNGRDESNENKPAYIDAALRNGFDVEIDIWMTGNTLYLGHDIPMYIISEKWIEERKSNLWIHCKNVEAIEWFAYHNKYNYFWHETDTVTITSKGYLWAYPGKQPIKHTIAVVPELYNDDLSVCKGICSDYIENYDNKSHRN